MKKIIVFIASLLSSVVLFGQAFFEVDASQEGKKISQELMGVFFEDINYGADGGLYAELVQNRSFEYYKVSNASLEPLTAWSLVRKGTADATMQIEDTNPLNANNTKYLKVNIKNAGNETGIKNTGFKGISVQANRKYIFSVYLRSETTFDQPIIVRIESGSGLILGSDTIRSISTKWKKYSLEIPCSQTNATASLNIATTGTGILYFDMVSLFPENTFKNRENGLRKDLAQAIFKTPVDKSVFTYTLRARKTGGNEGFLIPFAFADDKNFYWFNIGGWGNSQHAVEMSVNGSRSPLITEAGSIEKNQWYTIKIEVDRNSAKCYLDDKLLFDIPAPEGPVSASVTKDDETNEMIFKMVNSGSKAIKTSVKIKGLKLDQNVKVISLSGMATQRNTITSPDQVSPSERTIHVTNLFDLTLPANSFQLFRIKNNPKLK